MANFYSPQPSLLFNVRMMRCPVLAMMKSLRRSCIERPGRVAFPESLDPRVIMASFELAQEGSAREIHLFTSRDRFHAAARTLGLNLNSAPDVFSWPMADRGTQERLRDKLLLQATQKGKSVSDAQLNDWINDPLFLAGDSLSRGSVDAVIAGAACPTANVIRAAIATVGLATGVKTVSGSFLMTRPSGAWGGERIMLFADCGVVIDPSRDQLRDIALATVETWRTVVAPQIGGPPPVVAFLSFSTKGSAPHPFSQKVVDALHLFKEAAPDVTCDGELQFDAAWDMEVGKRKAPGSLVPGEANCFIFPDLNAGNLAYKIAQRLGSFSAIGPLLQGLAKPYTDLSRGATVADIKEAAYVNMQKARGTAKTT